MELNGGEKRVTEDMRRFVLIHARVQALLDRSGVLLAELERLITAGTHEEFIAQHRLVRENHNEIDRLLQNDGLEV